VALRGGGRAAVKTGGFTVKMGGFTVKPPGRRRRRARRRRLWSPQRRAPVLGATVARWDGAVSPGSQLTQLETRGLRGGGRAAVKPPIFTVIRPDATAADATGGPPGQILHSQRRARSVGVRVARRNGAVATRKGVSKGCGETARRAAKRRVAPRVERYTRAWNVTHARVRVERHTHAHVPRVERST
jgi:hypothetical protein